MCNNLHNFGLFQRRPGVMDKRLCFNLRNGKHAACNHEVMDALGRLLSTKEARLVGL